MTGLLIKLFVKDSENTKSPLVRKAYGALAGAVGICANFMLAALKLLAGILTGSVAVIADAFNNFSDAGSSVISLISFKLSAKPADKDHPFGHARMEYIASLIVSLMIVLVGFELLSSSGRILLGMDPVSELQLSPLPIIILSVSVLAKLWLGMFYRRVAKTIDSDVVKASATDSLSDMASTGAVLLSSVIIKLTGFAQLDAIVGIAVSAMIIVAGIKIMMETKDRLLGEAPVEDTIKEIKAVIAEYPDVIGTHDLLVHNYGPCNAIASFHAEVDGAKDIYYLHDMIDNLERRIKNELGISCTIHMDPIMTDDECTGALKAFVMDVMKAEELYLPIHDFRVVNGATHTNLIFDVVLPFDSKLSPNQVSEMISTAVSARRADHYCVITVDRG